VQAGQVCRPERCAGRRRCASRTGVQAGEVCRPEEVCKPDRCAGRRRCASRRGVQAGQVCKPEEVCKPERCASSRGVQGSRGVQAGEVCKLKRCASRTGAREGVQAGEVCKPERCAGQSRTYCFVPIRKLIDKECVTIRVWNRSAASVFEIGREPNLESRRRLPISASSTYATVSESELRQPERSVFPYASDNKNPPKCRDCNAETSTEYKTYSLVLYIR